MTKDRDLVDFLDKMMIMERVYSEGIRELSDRIGSPLFKGLFMAISIDSMKHSKLYETLNDMIRKSIPFISRGDLELIREEIRQHLDTEKRMIDVISNRLESEMNPKKKLIMEAILNDELIHHKLLLNIYEIIAKAEALTEEKMWDILWRDSPFHGTPGG